MFWLDGKKVEQKKKRGSTRKSRRSREGKKLFRVTSTGGCRCKKKEKPIFNYKERPARAWGT